MPESHAVAARVMQRLHHRGPDACDTRRWPDAALIHTRLSIIDLSPNGAQPMSNEDGTVWTVFNGEIYNHHEIRLELEKGGHRFRGHSDTEILTHLYEEEGPEGARKLRGMFAFAVYDTRKKTLVLVRDRFGIKPLFYSASPQRLAFASELNALRAVPGIDMTMDLQSLHDFAALFFIPAPQTFYKGIRALSPAEYLLADFSAEEVRFQTRKYHEWTIAPNYGLTLERAAEQTDHLLAASVKSQLESDVPLGALVSGGIDSSLVSFNAQNEIKSALRTFNVRFGVPDYDETWAAREVAQHIGSHHMTLDMDHVQGSWEEVIALLRHAGQPFADTSLFAVQAVSQLMRKHVTVALSGDGGD
jgi:asparagine synthase (glutamine-hydrolysing)